ncbi:MAG TPA: hypothetical protein VFX78_07160 [Candidatus Eisenbacteria bacterium]|nr:hypothetical protein [Candidatus Eisenbacteria bacterium]
MREAAAEFLEAFETVFHTDWDYTRSMLGMASREKVREKVDEGAALLARIFGEATPPPSDPDATFLDPRDPHLGANNWGNYENLLDAYAKLRAALGRGTAGAR